MSPGTPTFMQGPQYNLAEDMHALGMLSIGGPAAYENTILTAKDSLPIGPGANIPDFDLGLHFGPSVDAISVLNIASASALPPVGAAAQPTAPNVLVLSSVPGQCPHGCNGTFSRPRELRRHMKKHASHDHVCGQPGCGKSFYRKDKLRDHLWEKHRIETRTSARRGGES